MAKIWVFAECEADGKVASSALENLAKARELGDAEAVVLGPGASEAAKTLGEHGAKKVYLSDDSVFTDFVAQPAAYALWKLAEQHQPDMIVFGMDYDSRDIAARVAASNDSTVMGNATDIVGPDKAQTQIFGGRGLLEPGNFELLEKISKSIPNSAVGATRAVVDAGWVPYAMQVGQTGKTVKPGVYIAVGISGATQHVVGMKGAKRIIAINKDEEAPIFSISDLGIVGDALKVVPKLIEEVKSRKG